ncbi:MAG: peptide ABC transporter substrate-binding protein [Oscillospiraceae bacterium]|nr:peptide ABC transporter substrate-binding protein [Oscillospiraceae bacterium]
MKKRFIALLAGALAAATLLSACGGGNDGNNGDTPGGAPAQSSAPAGEQVLRVSMAGAPSDVGPLTSTTTEGAELLGCMFEGLVRQDAEGQIEQGSGLAESWTVSDDGLVYTFTIRDAVWSDGTPITAPQFAYCWEKVLNPATASEYAYMLYVIQNAHAYNTGELTDWSQVGVKATDDKTLEVTLEAPTDYFLEMLVIPQYGALPEGYVEECGADFYLDPQHMVFNGPFICTAWEPDQSMTFVKNEKYWDADAVRLDGIQYEFVIDTNTVVNLYETNELDVMLVQPEFLDNYRSASGFVSITEPVTEYLKFNFANEYFANENIRRAFSLALNRVSYMNDFMRTGSMPAYAYVPDSIHGPNEEGFRQTYGDLYYDIGTNEGAAQEAKDLLNKGLEEVGKTFDEFNQGLSLVIGEGDLNLKTAQVFQEYWKTNLGVDVEVRSMRYSLRQEAYDSNDFTIGKEGWGADYNDAQSFLELFESNSPYNDVSYSNPEFDRLMAEAKAATGDERLSKLQEAEKVLVAGDAAIAPTFFQTRSWVSKDNVGGIVRQGIGLRCDFKWAYLQ